MNKQRFALGFSILFAAISSLCQAQDTERGDQYFEKKDYKNALASYFLALRNDKSSASVHFKIGYTYLQTETKALSITYLEKAYRIDPEVDQKILYYLGIGFQSDLQYAKARQYFQAYKTTARKIEMEDIDSHIKQCVVSHGLLSNPIDVLIENVGSFINSKYDDFAPIASGDGNSLIFTSNRRTDSLTAKTRKGFEDIYIVTKNDNDEWEAPKKIGGAINMGSHDAAASLSPDGKTLFLYYDLNHGDIYSSKRNEKGEWEPPLPLGKNVNSPLFRETSASISADGKKLYFSSNRPGGKGNLDIYVSTWDEALGNWGKAVSVGNDVNTPGDEDSPCIHPDGITLYFSSDGHPGMGSSDIFKSNFKDGVWKKPENLGYPLNSIEYDGFFNISPDRSVAYFATKRKHGVGGYDILKASYRASYPDVIKSFTKVDNTKKNLTKPTASTGGVFAVKGKVLDKKSSQPLHVRISLVYVKTKKLIAQIESNASTGEYEMQVADAGKYILTAESEGYLFNSINIEVPQPIASKSSASDFQMVKADVGSIMVLKNIFFDTNKSDLKPSSILELEKIRELLVNNPNLKVQINGHTDNVGDPMANKALSLRRAVAVVNHLALNGIDINRLSAKGFGSEKPVASNDDEKGGREFNRRTEIEITDISASVSKL